MTTGAANLLTISVVGVAIALGAQAASAHGPTVGGEVAAAIPLQGTKRTVEGGGAAGIYGGYRFDFGNYVALSLLANPEFTFFASEKPRNPSSGRNSDSDVVSVMGLNAGPRLTLGGEEARFVIDGRGGYFRELSGPLNSSGPGYNVGGGLAISMTPATSLTILGRYNESFMRAQRGSHENFRFVTVGLGVEHRFGAPEPVAEAAPPPPSPPPPLAAPVKKRIILRGVNFDFDKADIRADARPVLDEAITTLAQAGEMQVSVEGHTDSVGSDTYNETLSVRRSRAVATYLADGGISTGRLVVSGFGEGKPVASNDTADGRAQNRRVELNVVSD